MNPVKNLTIAPSENLRGSVTPPGDKSMSHRAALFSALADGESNIDHFLVAGVTRRMLDGLAELGVKFHLDGERLSVSGAGLAGLSSPGTPIDCGSSATTLRLLAGAIAAAGIPAVLDGSEGLRRRPMNRIIQPLNEMGVRLFSANGHAPISFQPPAGPLQPPEHFILAVASAQVKTCLLLAGLASDRPVRILEPGPSRDHSERMLQAMGAEIRTKQIESEDGTIAYETYFAPPQALSPLDISLPGDFSSAAFLITAALITPGSDIRIKAVGINPTRTGLLDALRDMGANIEVSLSGEAFGEPFADLRIRYSKLMGTIVKGPLVVRMIDEFPVFAVAAAYAEGKTIVREAVELRHKESDRISALCDQLKNIGIAVEEHPDGFTIPGGQQPAGGYVRAGGDHRIAMAMVIAGLGAQKPVVLDDPAIISESFPGFTGILGVMGARLD